MNDHPGWAKPFIAMYANSPIVTLILDDTLEIRWENGGAYAELHVNFEEGTYTIESN